MLTIKKVDFNEVPASKRQGGTKNLELINEFLNGGYDAAEITDVDNPERRSDNIATAMKQSIKRFGHDGIITAITRSGKAFLVRKSLLG